MGILKKIGNWVNDLTGVSGQQEHQENMANTAHQREVADLKAAGINPVLSAGGDGAPIAQPGSSAGNPIADAINLMTSAKNVEKMNSEIDNIKANTENSTKLTESEVNKNNAEANLTNTSARNASTKTTQMINDENLANTWWGRNISPVLRDIFGSGAAQTVANTATSARNANKMANAIKKTPHTHVHYH